MMLNGLYELARMESKKTYKKMHLYRRFKRIYLTPALENTYNKIKGNIINYFAEYPFRDTIEIAINRMIVTKDQKFKKAILKASKIFANTHKYTMSNRNINELNYVMFIRFIDYLVDEYLDELKNNPDNYERYIINDCAAFNVRNAEVTIKQSNDVKAKVDSIFEGKAYIISNATRSNFAGNALFTTNDSYLSTYLEPVYSIINLIGSFSNSYYDKFFDAHDCIDKLNESFEQLVKTVKAIRDLNATFKDLGFSERETNTIRYELYTFLQIGYIDFDKFDEKISSINFGNITLSDDNKSMIRSTLEEINTYAYKNDELVSSIKDDLRNWIVGTKNIGESYYDTSKIIDELKIFLKSENSLTSSTFLKQTSKYYIDYIR